MYIESGFYYIRVIGQKTKKTLVLDFKKYLRP